MENEVINILNEEKFIKPNVFLLSRAFKTIHGIFPENGYVEEEMNNIVPSGNYISNEIKLFLNNFINLDIKNAKVYFHYINEIHGFIYNEINNTEQGFIVCGYDETRNNLEDTEVYKLINK